LGASAANNSRKKAAAAAAASVAWRPLDSGVLHLSNYGAYFDTEGRLYPFSFGDFQRVELTGPGAVQVSASMSTGSVETFWIVSEAAELLFVSWAMMHCPDHPQFRQLTWLPPEFVARVRYAGLWDQVGGGLTAISG
jgi:hypothetical protein